MQAALAQGSHKAGSGHRLKHRPHCGSDRKPVAIGRACRHPQNGRPVRPSAQAAKPLRSLCRGGGEGMELPELQIPAGFKLLDEVQCQCNRSSKPPQRQGQVHGLVGGRSGWEGWGGGSGVWRGVPYLQPSPHPTSLRLLRLSWHLPPHRQGAQGEVGGQARAVGERLRL